MSASRSVGGWTTDRVRVGIVLHSSSNRSLGIRLRLTGTLVVHTQQMHPCLNHRSQSMDTYRPTSALVIVTMHTTHMCQREPPLCTPPLFQLRPHSGPVVVARKVKNKVVIQELLPTYNQRSQSDATVHSAHVRDRNIPGLHTR